VDELAGTRALVPKRLLEAEPPEAPHPDPGQDPRDRRERHPQNLGDLGRREAKPPQLLDRLDPIGRRPIRHPTRRCGAITEAELALAAVTTHPCTRTAHANADGLGRRPQRPPLLDHSPRKKPATMPTESRVTVELQPVPP
jgi:hypothetical protein